MAGAGRQGMGRKQQLDRITGLPHTMERPDHLG